MSQGPRDQLAGDVHHLNRHFRTNQETNSMLDIFGDQNWNTSLSTHVLHVEPHVEPHVVAGKSHPCVFDYKVGPFGHLDISAHGRDGQNWCTRTV